MKDKMNAALWAVNKWMCFGWNMPQRVYHWRDWNGRQRSEYLPTFLVEVKWDAPLDHMIEKWKDACLQDADGALACFYATLGSHNRRILIEWVMNNYDNEIKI